MKVVNDVRDSEMEPETDRIQFLYSGHCLLLQRRRDPTNRHTVRNMEEQNDETSPIFL
jgi:hypothetical protein